MKYFNVKVVDRLRKDAHPIWREIIEHPFVVELYNGKLLLKKFKFYILQDYQYLITAMKNFGIIASRATSTEAMREVIDILHLEAKSEFDAYEELKSVFIAASRYEYLFWDAVYNHQK